MKVWFLNGPPRCGKDYGGAALSSLIQQRGETARCDKFARVLKEACHAAYGLIKDNGWPWEHDVFESVKDEPTGYFHGKTPRQVYIAFSETYMKPLHGDQVFGWLLKRDLVAGLAWDNLIVTDSGFREEAGVLVRAYGNHNCTLLRVHRERHDFSGDSRTYIDLEDMGVMSLDVDNDGTPDGYSRALHGALEDAWPIK